MKKEKKRFQKMHNELAHGLIPVESVGIKRGSFQRKLGRSGWAKLRFRN